MNGCVLLWGGGVGAFQFGRAVADFPGRSFDADLSSAITGVPQAQSSVQHSLLQVTHQEWNLKLQSSKVLDTLLDIYGQVN